MRVLTISGLRNFTGTTRDSPGCSGPVSERSNLPSKRSPLMLNGQPHQPGGVGPARPPASDGNNLNSTRASGAQSATKFLSTCGYQSPRVTAAERILHIWRRPLWPIVLSRQRALYVRNQPKGDLAVIPPKTGSTSLVVCLSTAFTPSTRDAAAQRTRMPGVAPGQGLST